MRSLKLIALFCVTVFVLTAVMHAKDMVDCKEMGDIILVEDKVSVYQHFCIFVDAKRVY